MAAEDGTEKYSLMDVLPTAPWELDFYQALRKLEAEHPEKPRIGQSVKASDDPMRFCQKPSLRFEPATLAGFTRATAKSKDRLFVAFFGLLGPHGPMPLHLTEYIRGRELQDNDPTPARFLDLFHHRLISLFYRAWRVNNQAASHDRPEDDRFVNYIGSLIGIGTSKVQHRDSIEDLAKLHYSGRLSAQSKNAEGLQAILEDYFHIRVEIIEFVGLWVPLPKENQLKLGKSPKTGTLGKTAIVGSKTWEVQHKFRIRMGPMGLKDYQRMLPGGNSLNRLRDWVRNYVGDELGFEVQLILKKEEVPKLRPGVIGQLGWTTWAHSKAPKKDADDLVLQVW